MIRPIILWPNELLHQKSRAVAEDDNVDELITDLLDTMYEAKGVGLSAIQIGVPLCVFVMDVKNRDLVFINPKIKHTEGGLEKKNEGCLSLPGIVEQVMRNNKVTVSYLDRDRNQQVQGFSDIEAQCIQHETEHLDGIVMPDKFSSARREMMRIIMKNRKKK